MDFQREAEAIRDQVIEWRRDIHRHPEVGGEEFRTAELVAKELTAMGINVRTGVGSPLPGVVGVLHGALPGKTAALRADMDALRIEESHDHDSAYRSQESGKMHACGHDAHTAILLGAAKLLSSHRDQLKGKVVFVFQPNEEGTGGAVPMMEDGAFDGHEPDAIFGLHVDPDFPAGQIVLSKGETMASSDRLTIHLKGKSTHGAYPHRGIDAIMLAAQFLTALQTIIAREKDTFDPAVFTFGVIEGGKQPNVVCDDVILRGICRTLNPECREMIMKHMERVLAGIASAFGGSYSFLREKSYMSLINDDSMVERLAETAQTLYGTQSVHYLKRARLVVEDFGFYLQKYPGAFWFLGTGNQERGICQPLHNQAFDIDESALAVGVTMQTAVVWRFLEKI